MNSLVLCVDHWSLEDAKGLRAKGVSPRAFDDSGPAQSQIAQMIEIPVTIACGTS